MRITKVEYLSGYKLKLTFSDKKVKIVDLSELANGERPIFRPLKDLSYFKKVKCDGFSIMWPNEADICPDVLYKMGEDVVPQARTRSRVTKSRGPRILKTAKQRKAKTLPSKT